MENKLLLKLIGLGIVLISWLLVGGNIYAQTNKQVVIVNPIRGKDFWQGQDSLLDVPQKQYQLISQYNLPATWLVRYDVLKDESVVNFLHSLNKSQEIGLFLEITPTLTQDSGVNYNQSLSWHYAKSVFLTGYSPDERKRMIDTAMEKYHALFGVYPKSVGAWWIDANSLDYMHQKYGVLANLDVSDQYSTDQYQVWGQYWSAPFYPSRVNALMPAQSPEQKIGVVTLQWATRDPYNGYGNSVYDSTYSVQSNDYLLHHLDDNYFQKLLAIYPEVTVGLENDFPWSQFGSEYAKQIQTLATEAGKGELQLKTMNNFYSYYSSLYPDISPKVLISSDDPLGGNGKVVWYQTPEYRVGWFYGPQGSEIRDLRIYNDSSQEPCLNAACSSLDLDKSFVNSIDDAKSNNGWVIDQGSISNVKISSSENPTITYTTQTGINRTIKFLPNDISIDDKTTTLSQAILNANSPQSLSATQSIPGSLSANFKQIFSLVIPDFLKFIILAVLFFFLPGYALTKRKLTAIPVGLAVFTLASFVLAILKINQLIWLLSVLGIVLIVFVGRPKLFKPQFNLGTVILSLVIILGSVSWLALSVKNGLPYGYGLGYWGPNGHDAIWHLALISELEKQVPPQNPIYAGEILENYHYFYDLLLAKSATLLSIDAQDLLFRLFPLLISALSGILMFAVTKKLLFQFGKEFKDKKYLTYLGPIMAVFLLYFGGSFGWVISYFRDKSLGGESMFWSQQSISTLLNPPFAISILLFLAGLYLYLDFIQITPKLNLLDFKKLKFWQSLDYKLLLPIILIWGVLVEFKVYAGVLVLLSLVAVFIEEIIFKKDFKTALILIPSGLLALVVFLPNNLSSSSLLVFQPLWLIYSMVNFQDRLNWTRLGLALQSNNLFKLIVGNIIGIGIFLIGNLGTRLLAILGIKHILKNRFLLYVSLIGIILPLVFIQKGNDWNIIQFFYYSLLVFDIFIAFAISSLFLKVGPKVGSLIIVLIILLTIPTTIGVLPQYLPARPPAALPTQEVEALNFLKSQPQGVVLTFPFDEKMAESFNPPKPLYAYDSNAYVAAFSGKATFLSDTINLEILGIDYKGRVDDINDFIKYPEKAREILKRDNISYIYLPQEYNFQVDEGRMGIKQIFENDQIRIFSVL